MNKFFIFLLILLSFLSFRTLLRKGYFPMHDDMQAMRVLQMEKCFADFQIPCRWVPDMGYGYGYPQFNYYGPLPYYFMYFFHFFGLGILSAVKLGFIVTIFFSVIGMYLLGSYLFGNFAGFISALFFIYSPYRAVDMYVRGAVGEFWALSFLPFIFLYSKKIIDKKEKKSFYFLSIFLSLIFLSHNITTIIVLPILFLWIIFLLVIHFAKNKKINFEVLFNLGLSLFFGFLLSAFFSIPAFFEKRYVHVETMLSGYFDYRQHFLSLNQILFSNFWGYGSSEIGPYDGLSFSIGLLHWIIPTFVFFITVFIFKKLKNKERMLYFLFFLTIGWFAFFMTHSKSTFFWNKFSLLAYFQFPWRFITLALFSFSLSLGYIFSFFKNFSTKIIFLFVLLFFLFLFNLSFFKPSGWLKINDELKFSGINWDLQQTISIFDYLPKSADFPPTTRAPEYLISDSIISSVLVKKGSNKQLWKVNVIEDSSEISLPIYNFPGWSVFVNNQKINIYEKSELGLITFQIDKGDYDVYAVLKNTKIRLMANMLTLIGVGGLLFYYKYFLYKND